MSRYIMISLLLIALSTSAQCERIWIEAENTTARNFEGPMEFVGIVSGDKILHLWENNDPGPEGYLASWEFNISKAGVYHIWASPSIPHLTSNFWWKIDNGDYHHVTDEIDYLESKMFGVSDAQCWVELGRVRLSSGRHTITIKVNERRPSLEHAYLLYIDAFLITDENIRPNGLVMAADVPKLQYKPAEVVKQVSRAGKPGKAMTLATNVMTHPQNKLVKSLGFSILQTDSDHLSTNEVSPGVWDWSDADRGLEASMRVGLRWQYFPHFHWANEWLKKTDKFVPSTCIGHGWKIGAMSVWSPYILDLIDNGYKAMADHYGSGTDKVKAIYLGIHGDFGETMYPMGLHPDEIKRFGVEGSGHNDWWCGDAFARKDFQSTMQNKYETIDKLNTSWGTNLTSFNDINYPLPVPDIKNVQDRHRWLDFLNWYNRSLTQYTEDICRIARSHFPEALMQIPIGGGDVNVLYGTEHTAYAKSAKKYGVHIRSTHGGYLPVPQNYASMLRLIATSCKFYKVPFWSEPPGGISEEGEVGRFFESISCGSYGYWDWGSNPVASPNVFRKYRNFLTRENPVVDVAFFWPTTNIHLHPEVGMPQRFVEGAAAIRDVMDYDILDESLIEDGALKDYRVLALFEGEYVKASTLEKIADWVRAGGVVVSYNYGPVFDVDGDNSIWRNLFGITEHSSTSTVESKLISRSPFIEYSKSRICDATMSQLAPGVVALAAVQGQPAIWANSVGKGYGIYYAGSWDTRSSYYELLRDVVYNLHALDANHRNAIEVDKDWDGVYCTLLPSHEVILYNQNKTAVTKKIGAKTIKMEPVSLQSIMLDED